MLDRCDTRLFGARVAAPIAQAAVPLLHIGPLILHGKTGKASRMDAVTISTKGQLVIPTRFRKALHLKAGDKVSFSLEGDKLVLQREQPRRARLVEKNGRKVLIAPPGAPPMTPAVVKALLADFP